MSNVSLTIGPKTDRKKNNERYAMVVAWLRTRVFFKILKSVHMSVRGSRSPLYRNEFEVVEDFGLNVKATEFF